jgi:hypothetical protein
VTGSSADERLQVFPVKMTQEAIYVDSGAAPQSIATTRGGADTSLENNNVFAVQPSVYVQGSEQDASSGDGLSTALTLSVAISCFAIIATAGTATALFYEDFVLLGGFWLLMLVAGGYFAYQFQQGRSEQS